MMTPEQERAHMDNWQTEVEATAARLAQHLPHETRAADEPPIYNSGQDAYIDADDTDPFGKHADRAAANAWWSQVEPEAGRWAT